MFLIYAESICSKAFKSQLIRSIQLLWKGLKWRRFMAEAWKARWNPVPHMAETWSLGQLKSSTLPLSNSMNHMIRSLTVQEMPKNSGLSPTTNHSHWLASPQPSEPRCMLAIASTIPIHPAQAKSLAALSYLRVSNVQQLVRSCSRF